MICGFDDLPVEIRDFLMKLQKKWVGTNIQDWIHIKIPALKNRSIVEALNDGDRKSVDKVLLYHADIDQTPYTVIKGESK